MVHRYEEEEDFGAVGRISSKPKKKTPKVYSVEVTAKRYQKPVENWTGYDLGIEFSYRTREKFPELVAQANPVLCVKIFSKLKKERNLSSQEIYSAMNIFFDDERNFSKLGEGRPLWTRFLARFPYLQAQARRESGVDDFDWEEEARNV